MSETLEIRPKEFKMVDGHAVKEPEDYQDPELLYQSLIKRIREYHPSGRHTGLQSRLTKDRRGSPESLTSSIHFG